MDVIERELALLDVVENRAVVWQVKLTPGSKVYRLIATEIVVSAANFKFGVSTSRSVLRPAGMS